MTTYAVSLKRELAMYIERKAIERGMTPVEVIRECIRRVMMEEERRTEREGGESDEERIGVSGFSKNS